MFLCPGPIQRIFGVIRRLRDQDSNPVSCQFGASTVACPLDLDVDTPDLVLRSICKLLLNRLGTLLSVVLERDVSHLDKSLRMVASTTKRTSKRQRSVEYWDSERGFNYI